MRNDLIAKHRYRYVIESPYPVGFGNKFTGTVQVARPYSDKEVFDLALKMSNVIPKGSKLISVKEVEQPHGLIEGDKCNRDGCEGEMQRYGEPNCSCHVVAPCSSCVNAEFSCDTCDFLVEAP